MLALARSQDDARLTELVGPRSALVRQLTLPLAGDRRPRSTAPVSSTNRDGIEGARIGRAVRETITSDLKHAQQVALRIRQLHAPAPGRDRLRYAAALTAAAGGAARQCQAAHWPDRGGDRCDRALPAYRGAGLGSRDWITGNLTNQVIREKETHLERLRSFMRNE